MKNTEQKSNELKPILNENLSRIMLGLSEIGNLDIDDFDINMAITKNIANLSVVEKIYQKTGQALAKKHVKVGENGNLALTENNLYIFKSQEDKDIYQAAVDALNDTVVTEKVWTLKASDLKKIKGIKGTTMAKCHELIIDDLK